MIFIRKKVDWLFRSILLRDGYYVFREKGVFRQQVSIMQANYWMGLFIMKEDEISMA